MCGGSRTGCTGALSGFDCVAWEGSLPAVAPPSIARSGLRAVAPQRVNAEASDSNQRSTEQSCRGENSFAQLTCVLKHRSLLSGFERNEEPLGDGTEAEFSPRAEFQEQVPGDRAWLPAVPPSCPGQPALS